APASSSVSSSWPPGTVGWTSPCPTCASTCGDCRAADRHRPFATLGGVSTIAPTPRGIIPREIWILVGAAFVIALGFGIVSPVLPAYARSFDVGVAAASVIVSAFAFFRLVFAPAGGALVE